MSPPKHLNEKSKSDVTKSQMSGTEAPNIADALSINLSTVYYVIKRKRIRGRPVVKKALINQ